MAIPTQLPSHPVRQCQLLRLKFRLRSVWYDQSRHEQIPIKSFSSESVFGRLRERDKTPSYPNSIPEVMF